MRRSFHQQVQLANWANEHVSLPHVPQPEHWPPEARMETGKLPALRHGDHLISLSAAFAAVNALRLVAHGSCSLTVAEEQALLGAAWEWGRAREALRPDRGLRQSDWPRLIESLCHCFSRQHGQFVRTSQPWRHTLPTRDEFFVAVERLIVSRHVLLGLLVGAQFLVV